MKLKLTYIFFFIVAFQMYAQIDSDQKTINIPAEETKETDSIPSKFKIKPNEKLNITKTGNNISGIPIRSKVAIKEEKEEFSMFNKSKLLDPGQLFEDRLNKKAVEQGYKIESMADQFLGNFISNGEFVNIKCRDHEYPDGDLVQVRVNGDIIIPRLMLTSGYKSFDIQLVEGINKIDFLALNQGSSGPNTAEFQVYDDEGKLVSSKKWNLLTGVKATIIVIKEPKND